MENANSKAINVMTLKCFVYISYPNINTFVVVQLLSHVWFCDPMDCSTPGFPVLHCLLEFVQTHVLWVSDAMQPSHPLSPPSPLALSLSPNQSFPVSWLFPSDGQSIRASALASVLPVNIQDWFCLGLTGLISLQSKGLTRVFSSTIIRKHQFFSAHFYRSLNSHFFCRKQLDPGIWLCDPGTELLQMVLSLLSGCVGYMCSPFVHYWSEDALYLLHSRLP